MKNVMEEVNFISAYPDDNVKPTNQDAIYVTNQFIREEEVNTTKKERTAMQNRLS